MGSGMKFHGGGDVGGEGGGLAEPWLISTLFSSSCLNNHLSEVCPDSPI